MHNSVYVFFFVRKVYCIISTTKIEHLLARIKKTVINAMNILFNEAILFLYPR